eukprot:2981262-Lingulodinium_polyedra.AAC.1
MESLGAAGQLATSGPRGRGAAFLLRLLAPATQRRYQEALAGFEEWCSVRRLPFAGLSAELQDWRVADYCLDLMDEGEA